VARWTFGKPSVLAAGMWWHFLPALPGSVTRFWRVALWYLLPASMVWRWDAFPRRLCGTFIAVSNVCLLNSVICMWRLLAELQYMKPVVPLFVADTVKQWFPTINGQTKHFHTSGWRDSVRNLIWFGGLLVPL